MSLEAQQRHEQPRTPMARMAHFRLRHPTAKRPPPPISHSFRLRPRTIQLPSPIRAHLPRRTVPGHTPRQSTQRTRIRRSGHMAAETPLPRLRRPTATATEISLFALTTRVRLRCS